MNIVKNVLFIAAALFTANSSVFAENDTLNLEPEQITEVAPADDAKKDSASNWVISMKPSMQFNQDYYDNWVKDGYKRLSLTGAYVGTYVYTKNNFVWDNRTEFAFGFLRTDLNGDGEYDYSRYLRKSEDKIDLTSTLTWKWKNNWGCNVNVNFKSQFYDGYKFSANEEEEPSLLSTFFAPAYLVTSAGFEYKRDVWNISFSFISGKSTFVLDERINPQSFISDSVRSYFGLGSYFKAYFKKDIAKNLNLYTRIELFWDYKKSLFRDTDINFETVLEYRFNNWLAAFVGLNVIYDTDFNLKRQLYQKSGLQIYFDWKK